MLRKEVVKSLPFHIIHHEERFAVVLLEGAERDDIGMRQLHRNKRALSDTPTAPARHKRRNALAPQRLKLFHLFFTAKKHILPAFPMRRINDSKYIAAPSNENLP